MINDNIYITPETSLIGSAWSLWECYLTFPSVVAQILLCKIVDHQLNHDVQPVTNHVIITIAVGGGGGGGNRRPHLQKLAPKKGGKIKHTLLDASSPKIVQNTLIS